MIGRPKLILIAMRKTQSYRETKMRLLQKLTGVDFLSFTFDGGKVQRDWFSGINKYHDLQEIVNDYVSGSPLSCFSGNNEDGLFYICFFSGSNATISYLTLEASPSDLFIKDCGAHYCAFNFVKDTNNQVLVKNTVEKDSLKGLVGSYALLLPFLKQGRAFQNQFTLVYHDWDVLPCQDGGLCKKGLPMVDHCVFNDQYTEYLSL